ncbi:transglycosylase domain-containing protein [Aneurinibacillus sp. UBA3580]|jgi:penicillin-binding protein|uniref:transglycosylase domain-containing protein n=1 Tax=Aneurinibacillus sp. UBA3580 TaxID=1946041 RepID=UPI00257A3866|nr:PBP1A family penicillin-binding protein [Aneurinibacillus sp. UBA3580]
MEKQNGSVNTPDRPRRKKSFWHTLLIVFQVSAILFFMGVLFAGGTAAGYVASLVKSDPVRSYNEIYQKISANNLTGFAYFRDKKMIGQLITAEDRRLVSHKEVSPHLIDAIIATEDKYFYEHNGIVPSAIARAALQQITNSPVQTGGSTLTQQLIKQTILSPKVTPERKFKEIFLALRMERMFSKEQILDAYINKMYFGQNANRTNLYGVQAAAKGIFGVDAKDLNIAQSAYLAGMLQAPYSYIPFKEKGLKLGKERQKLVLSRMLENGKITKQQYDEALAYDIKAHLLTNPPKPAIERYPYLMIEIEERAAKILLDQDFEKNPELKNEPYSKLLEEKRMAVRQGGYHIYTTIDQKIYDKMHAIAKDPNNFGPDRNPIGDKKMPQQVAAVLLDNKTGAIIGMIEGRDNGIEKTNFATSPRQPGSTIKSIGVYAPAIEEGIISPNSIVVDEETEFRGYKPSNYGESFKGPMTVRQALARSQNIPAVKVYFETGVEKSLNYVKKMGVTSIVKDDYYLSTALGGFTKGISVEEMTNAYATFPNGGNFVDAYMIERIVDSEGETVYQHKPKPVRVFSPQTSWMMTDMMRDVIEYGTGRQIARYRMGRDVAGKTGTSQEYRDRWFIGYTPDISLGVWTGYDMKYSLQGRHRDDVLRIWGKIFTSALEIDPNLSPAGNYMKRPPGTSMAAIYNANLATSKNPASYGGKTEEEKKAEEEQKKTENENKQTEQPVGSQPTDGENKQTDQNDGTSNGNQKEQGDQKQDEEQQGSTDGKKEAAETSSKKQTRPSDGQSNNTSEKKSDKTTNKTDAKKGEG